MPTAPPPRPCATDCCPLVPWGCRAALREPTWHLLSHHATSDGGTDYCRCACGTTVILHGGGIAALVPGTARG